MNISKKVLLFCCYINKIVKHSSWGIVFIKFHIFIVVCIVVLIYISSNSTNYDFWYALAVPVSAVGKHFDKFEQLANHADDVKISIIHHCNPSL